MRHWLLGILLLLVACVAPARADDAITIRHDSDRFLTHVTVPAHQGQIAWSDVLRGLAKARSLDPDALAGLLPGGTFPLDGIATRLSLAALNSSLDGDIRLVRVPAAKGGEGALEIVIDRRALLASERRFEASLRKSSLSLLQRTGWVTPAVFGLEFDAGLPTAAAGKDPASADKNNATKNNTEKNYTDKNLNKNLVLFVHGLNSSPERSRALCDPLRQAGFACATFRYPNDQSLAESAALLSRELKQFQQDHPERGISVVAFSAGGLIVREAIENAALDPGNVRQLILIAPPNHGSRLANFAFGLDLWEHVVEEARRGAVSRFYASIEDGLGDAAVDLVPDSPFLKALNARARNPQVSYSILLGCGGLATDADLLALRAALQQAGRYSRFAQLFGPRLDALLCDLDEVVQQKGDGAVSIQRGQLDGVSDTVVMDFRHLTCTCNSQRHEQEQLHAAILERLQR